MSLGFLGKYADALQQFATALPPFDESFGPDHIDNLLSRDILAFAHACCGEYASAKTMIDNLIEMLYWPKATSTTATMDKIQRRPFTKVRKLTTSFTATALPSRTSNTPLDTERLPAS
jgi:hypothetical protein